MSGVPGELVFRVAIARKTVRGLFDGPDIVPGQVVYARRSPFDQSAHALWLESEDGTLLSIIDPRRFEAEFDIVEGRKWTP